jgi:hypothetical protein
MGEKRQEVNKSKRKKFLVRTISKKKITEPKNQLFFSTFLIKLKEQMERK